MLGLAKLLLLLILLIHHAAHLALTTITHLLLRRGHSKWIRHIVQLLSLPLLLIHLLLHGVLHAHGLLAHHIHTVLLLLWLTVISVAHLRLLLLHVRHLLHHMLLLRLLLQHVHLVQEHRRVESGLEATLVNLQRGTVAEGVHEALVGHNLRRRRRLGRLRRRNGLQRLGREVKEARPVVPKRRLRGRRLRNLLRRRLLLLLGCSSRCIVDVAVHVHIGEQAAAVATSGRYVHVLLRLLLRRLLVHESEAIVLLLNERRLHGLLLLLRRASHETESIAWRRLLLLLRLLVGHVETAKQATAGLLILLHWLGLGLTAAHEGERVLGRCLLLSGRWGAQHVQQVAGLRCLSLRSGRSGRELTGRLGSQTEAASTRFLRGSFAHCLGLLSGLLGFLFVFTLLDLGTLSLDIRIVAVGVTIETAERGVIVRLKLRDLRVRFLFLFLL